MISNVRSGQSSIVSNDDKGSSATTGNFWSRHKVTVLVTGGALAGAAIGVGLIASGVAVVALPLIAAAIWAGLSGGLAGGLLGGALGFSLSNLHLSEDTLMSAQVSPSSSRVQGPGTPSPSARGSEIDEENSNFGSSRSGRTLNDRVDLRSPVFRDTQEDEVVGPDINEKQAIGPLTPKVTSPKLHRSETKRIVKINETYSMSKPEVTIMPSSLVKAIPPVLETISQSNERVVIERNLSPPGTFRKRTMDDPNLHTDLNNPPFWNPDENNFSSKESDDKSTKVSQPMVLSARNAAKRVERDNARNKLGIGTDESSKALDLTKDIRHLEVGYDTVVTSDSYFS